SLYHFPYFYNLVGIKSCRGFIQDQYFRIMYERSSKSYSLLISFRKLTYFLFALRRKTCCFYRLFYFLFFMSEVMNARDEVEVFSYVHIIIKGIGFRQVADVFFSPDRIVFYIEP